MIPFRSATPEQVLRALAALAMSPAFTKECDAFIAAAYAATPLTVLFTAQDGSTTPYALDSDAGPSTSGSYAQGFMPNGFLVSSVTDHLRIVPPFPSLELYLGRGQYLVEEHEYGEWQFPIEAVAITSADNAADAQRQALFLIERFEMLIRRNDFLGGMVELIRSDGPPIAGGAHPAQNDLVAAAMIRLNVRTLRSLFP